MTTETLSEIFSTLRADFQAQTIVNPIDHIHDALSALSWDEMTEFQALYGPYLENELSRHGEDLHRTLTLYMRHDRLPHHMRPFRDVKKAFLDVLQLTLPHARKRSDWRIEAFAHFSLNPDDYAQVRIHEDGYIDVDTGLRVKKRACSVARATGKT